MISTVGRTSCRKRQVRARAPLVGVRIARFNINLPPEIGGGLPPPPPPQDPLDLVVVVVFRKFPPSPRPASEGDTPQHQIAGSDVVFSEIVLGWLLVWEPSHSERLFCFFAAPPASRCLKSFPFRKCKNNHALCGCSVLRGPTGLEVSEIPGGDIPEQTACFVLPGRPQTCRDRGESFHSWRPQ
jgi:hypothetical protein